ncbi:hypothetical protein N7540_011098 [Penicillium herquei]|nr:hypothetical protein N7540_011098 [Penicillium herquei]
MVPESITVFGKTTRRWPKNQPPAARYGPRAASAQNRDCRWAATRIFFVENLLLELLGSLASPILADNSNKFPMATQDSDDNFVESLEIPSSIKDIYTAACRNDQSIAESLSIPSDRISATLLVQGPGREVIAKIEEESLVSAHDSVAR